MQLHVHFGVQCGPGGEQDTVVLIGTYHPSMVCII